MAKAPASSWAPQKLILVPAPVQNDRNLAVVRVFVVVVTVSLYQSFGNKVMVDVVPVNVPSFVTDPSVPVDKLNRARPRFVGVPSSIVKLKSVALPFTNKLPVYVIAEAALVND